MAGCGDADSLAGGVLMSARRQHGQFYTQHNPFRHAAFADWSASAGLPDRAVLEPYAGALHIIDHLREIGCCRDFAAYDIAPGAEGVVQRDTIAEFPRGFSVCVTNPPWLARNVASRLGFTFPATLRADVYQAALERCLECCEYVAVLVPGSFLRCGQFRERLTAFVSLPSTMFASTASPVGLALFSPDTTRETMVWSGENLVGDLAHIESLHPRPARCGRRVVFNAPEGNVGLIALDNTRAASIRFCLPSELGTYDVRPSCRSITRIAVDCSNIAASIALWNSALAEYRQATLDVLMLPFRGLRADGRYRRRMDWHMARGIIQQEEVN